MTKESGIKILEKRVEWLLGRRDWLEDNLVKVNSEIEGLNYKIRELAASV
jgi:prefoldin subunit 5